MSWQTILAIAAGILALLALLAYLFRRKKKKQDQEGESGAGGSGGSGDGGDDGDGSSQDQQSSGRNRAAEEAAKRELERKKAIVRETLGADPELAQILLQQVGMLHANPKDVSSSEEMVRKIAQRLPEHFLQLMKVASNQTIVDINLKSTERQVPVPYPTRNMSIEPISDLGQLPEIDATDMMKPDDQFYDDLVNQRMLVPHHTATEKETTIGYVLLDGSGSMDYPTRSGLPRHIPARGITLNLLIRAKQGKSKYFFRMFDGAPHGLQKATMPQEAAELMKFVLDSGFTGGGTNIRAAIETAVADIRTQKHIKNAEIVLISDGDDTSCNDVAYMKQLLGDIRLHVCLITQNNPSLEQIAATYRYIP